MYMTEKEERWFDSTEDGILEMARFDPTSSVEFENRTGSRE